MLKYLIIGDFMDEQELQKIIKVLYEELRINQFDEE